MRLGVSSYLCCFISGISLLRGAELVSTYWRMVACSQVLIFFGLHFSALWWQYLQIAFLCLFFFLPIIALCCIFLSRLCVTFCLEAGGREWVCKRARRGSRRCSWPVSAQHECASESPAGFPVVLVPGPHPEVHRPRAHPWRHFPGALTLRSWGLAFSLSLCTVYFLYIF